ncbi:MAG TPA: beta-ketoacyl-[acyl-carrier-protein] synthase family protein [Armatimonadota bacterium]|nr:beta-ketoacyl-[acyl-carrier-protein] synthase family protein [Armatimonadota bacterium]
MQLRRVGITGMGVVSCLGVGVEAFGEALFAGRSGLSVIDRFDPAGLRNGLMGVVRDVPPLPDWAPGGTSSRDVVYAFSAADEALRSAGLVPPLSEPRTGCVLSTNFAGAEAMTRFAECPEDGSAFAACRFDTVVRGLASALSMRGPAFCVSVSCASGTAAIGLGSDLVRTGRARRVLAGGYDVLALLTQAGLSCIRTISTDTVRPFDVNRSQTIFGEGAAMVVLEDLEDARARGAPVRAEVLGHGMNNNAHHLTAPDKEGEGIAAGMRMAFEDAGIDPAEVDYVNAHGTGTEYHDVTEVKALKAVLGARAREIPVSSTKAATAHSMGAAGSMELVASVLAIERNMAPPTLNLTDPDPECDLDHVPGVGKPFAIDVVLSNSAGIGGGNASIVIARPGWRDARTGGGRA